MKASWLGDKDTVKLLLSLNPDISLKNNVWIFFIFYFFIFFMSMYQFFLLLSTTGQKNGPDVGFRELSLVHCQFA